MVMLFRQLYPSMKRCIDFLAALLLIVLLSLPLLILCVIVRATSPGPSIFWSERIGRNGVIFTMPKLRTMTTCSKVMARELASDQDCKLTPVGGFLRKTSLDELPQIWSILMGHMSFIGPRPLLASDEAARLRFSCEDTMSVRPGITGLAQVKGRNYVNPSRKVRYDSFYARNVCFFLDARIALSTLKILHRFDMVK